MGIREKLNQHQKLVTGLVGIVFVAAIAAVTMSNRPPPERAESAYYSDDGGKTYFTDDIDKVYPFDHKGKPAYRAYVYRFGGGEPFVSYLARYTDSAQQRLNELAAKAKDQTSLAELQVARGSGIEVAKAGSSEWRPVNSAEGAAISAHPVGPDGKRGTPVSP